MDLEKRLQKATIAMREHKDSHGAEDQVATFYTVLQEYNIGPQQLGYITGKSTFSSLYTAKQLIFGGFR